MNWFLVLLILIGALFAAPVISAADSRTITDIANNFVDIPTDVSRIVTVDPFTSQFFFIIGADDKLVGTCIGPANRDLVNVTEPTLGSLPSAGCKTKVNLEQLLTLKPELVISDQSYGQVNDDIKRAEVPLAVVDVEKPEHLIKSYEMIGQITGKEKETADFISYYNGKIDIIKNTTAKISDSDKKRVYFGQRDPLSTLGDDYYEAEIAALVGGKNVAEGLSGGDNKVTIDQIYTWNPDVVILLPYNSKSVSDILADPAWQSLPAVQKKQVYRMPKYLMSWELPVPETILGSMWLQSTLYPDKAKFSMNNEIKDFYKKFYRLDLTSQDIDGILKDQTPIILNQPVSS
ncbi:MAG TPA: ABC transporter substrate-binding protein [Methanospirillum sp.]|nr:ABC transporter substrate-binding protein [Methanospirillum sp.]